MNVFFTGQFCIVSGGTFTLYMKFDEHFNLRPPEVCFHTIPFHPNGKGFFDNLQATDNKYNCATYFWSAVYIRLHPYYTTLYSISSKTSTFVEVHVRFTYMTIYWICSYTCCFFLIKERLYKNFKIKLHALVIKFIEGAHNFHFCYSQRYFVVPSKRLSISCSLHFICTQV